MDNEFDKILNDLKQLKPRLMSQAAVMAVNFFKDSFRKQGFTNNTLEPWKKRIPGTARDSGRAILVDRGILRRAIKKKSSNTSKAIIGVDGVKHAEIHNNGGKIPVTNKMRRYFWAMYYRHANAITYDRKTKKAANNKRNQALTAQALFWKNLALTTKTHIDMPKRQFIGDSKTLERNIETLFNQELTKIFNA